MEERLRELPLEDLVRIYQEAEQFSLYGQLGEETILRQITLEVFERDMGLHLMLASMEIYRYLIKQFINRTISIEEFQKALDV